MITKLTQQLLEDLQTQLNKDLLDHGFIQNDRRLRRVVKSIAGHAVNLQEHLIVGLEKGEPLAKYEDDWKRMTPSFIEACSALLTDFDTRQAVFFNDQDYSRVHQCFTHFQVVKQKAGYGMIVYQRSGDIAKLKDDVQFFGYVAKELKKKTTIKLQNILIIYGNLHVEIDS